ncbi:MAG: ABC transporter substrate-binding protein [Planctomycetaceae bacterium]
MLSSPLRTALLIFAACASLGCERSRQETTGDSQSLKKVTVQLNWYAEAEHGGVYQAQADGTYRNAGFDVEIRPGGRATPVAAEVVMRRADFAITNADDVVLFRNAGSDIVAVMAALQDNPRCILVRADSSMTSWEGLKGMTLQRQEGQGFVGFLRARGHLEGVKEVPYFNSVANLVADPTIAAQAYSFAEPFLAKEAGADVRTWMVSDLGWNPYSSVLVTGGELIREQPELVREFVAATKKGWQNYMTDPSLGNAAILAANQHGMTADALRFGSQALVELARPDDMPLEQVGKMSAERWQALIDQMIEIKVIEPGAVDANACFTTEYLD